MPSTDTPLRYPGGKTQMAPYITRLMTRNNLQGGHYAEPFAGGAGVAWRLLFAGVATEVWLNDIDPNVFAFWDATVHQTEELAARIMDATLTMDEWQRQRAVFRSGLSPAIDRAYATLFLNRTNRSGILDGGVIGGNGQAGKYKLDCRFNRADLARKVLRIGRYRDVVHLSNLDARLCIAQWDRALPQRALINIDPPYFAKGSELYINHFEPRDHAALAHQVRRLQRPWMLTYDDTPEIEALYAGLPTRRMDLLYSAQVKRRGAELLVLSPRIHLPDVPHLQAA